MPDTPEADASLGVRWEIDGEQADAEPMPTLDQKLLASLAESEMIRQAFMADDEA